MNHSAGNDKKKMLFLVIAAVVVIAIITVIIGVGDKDSANAKVNTSVEKSITALKETWNLVYDDIDELVNNKTFSTSAAEDRKLEIRGVRVIEINSQMHESYKDVEYIVEFTLYSNRYRTAPYYIPEDIYNTVLVYADGRYEVQLRSVFKTMADDFKNDTVIKLVKKVYDFNDEYNTVLDLNK